MAKAPAEIRSLAREHTESALKTLAHIMRAKNAPAAARVAASNSLLDRGWGKAATVLENGEGGPLQILVKKFVEESE